MRHDIVEQMPSSQKTITLIYERQNKIPGFRVLSLLNYETEGERKSQGILIYVVSVACCCGLCVPNMRITKANAKESLRELTYFSIPKVEAK